MSKCAVKDAITVNMKKYKYLESPGNFDVDTISGNYLDKIPDANIDKIFSVWVECKFVRNNYLPLDPNDAKAANPRAPDCEHPVVAEMKGTLKHKPEKFTTLNGGISIVCDNVAVNKNILTISLQTGDGIVNGGHTYYSIVSSGKISSSAYVKIEFIQISNKISGVARREVIKDIAVSRNKNRAVSDESEANFLGYFEPWKNTLAQFKSHISWKDGDVCKCSVTGNNIEKPLKAKDLIKLMAWFEYKSNNFHIVYNKQKFGTKSPSKSQWENWVKEVNHKNDPLGWMMPLTIPILELREWFGDRLSKTKKSVPMTSLMASRAAGGGPGTVKSYGRPFSTDFGEYLMKGVKDSPSVFDSSTDIKKLGALAEHIFGNFRSLLWRKNMKDGKVLTGWQYNPVGIWNVVGEQIIGAIYYEWTHHNYNALSLQRRCTDMFVIDFCEWVEVEDAAGKKTNLRLLTNEYTPPEIIYFDDCDWVQTESGKTPEMWLNLAPKEVADFSSKKLGKNSIGYSKVV